jgi:hypothetical protein
MIWPVRAPSFGLSRGDLLGRRGDGGAPSVGAKVDEVISGGGGGQSFHRGGFLSGRWAAGGHRSAGQWSRWVRGGGRRGLSVSGDDAGR